MCAILLFYFHRLICNIQRDGNVWMLRTQFLFARFYFDLYTNCAKLISFVYAVSFLFLWYDCNKHANKQYYSNEREINSTAPIKHSYTECCILTLRAVIYFIANNVELRSKPIVWNIREMRTIFSFFFYTKFMVCGIRICTRMSAYLCKNDRCNDY